jgi:outer membrane biosynthesis protein TonB
VSKGSDRDAAIARLLRTAARGPLPPAAPGCVDAERLAAWTDGGLPPADAALVETHLADCARCQAILAAFASTADAAAGAAVQPASPRWRGGLVRWALPLAGAIAAGVLIWIAAPASVDPPAPVQQSAKSEPQFSVPPPAPAETPTATPAPPQESPTAAPVPPPAATPPPEPAPAPTTSSALPRNPTADPLPLAAPPPAVVVDEFGAGRVSSDASTKAVEKRATGGERVGTVGGVRGGRSADAAPPPAAMTSSVLEPSVRWRVWSDGRVERSQDGGASWQPAPIDRSIGITAGSAPDVLVCWLVGRQGAVFVTRDGGASFARVDIPNGPDLTGIQPENGLRAVATGADGSTFLTEDGGATWR